MTAEYTIQRWPSGRGIAYAPARYASHAEEFAALFGTKPYRVPSALAAGTPLAHARGEVEALRALIIDDRMRFSRRAVAECLAHILREIDRRAADWDANTGAALLPRKDECPECLLPLGDEHYCPHSPEAIAAVLQ